MADDFDQYTFYRNLSDEDRDKISRLYEKWGIISPKEDNVFVEAGQAFSQSLVSAGRGLGATFNELGMGSGVQDYFTGVLRRNQQWNAPSDMGASTYIARALGSGTGSTVGILGASAAGGLINPAFGFGTGLTVGFAQTFGDNVQRNRAAGYSEKKALGMAFLESAVDTTIENLPGGIVGKQAKKIGFLKNLTESGKKALMNKVGQKMAAEVGQEQAQNLLWQWAKKTTVSGLGESGEEGLQSLNSYINQKLGGDPNAEFSIEELADAMAQGFIGGFGMGSVTNIAEVRNESNRGVTKPVPETVPAAPEGFAETSISDPASSEDFAATSLSDVSAVSDMGAETSVSDMGAEQSVNSLSDEVIRGVAEEFGVKVDYVDNYKGDKKIAEDATGFFDKSTNTIYLGRDARDDLGVTLGHEFKHFLDKEHADLVKGFDAIWESGQTEEGKKFFQNLAKDWGLSEDIKQQEFSAEVFGKIFVRPETWRSYAENLERQTPGLGEKFIKVLQQFIQAIKKRLAGLGELAEQSPDAEVLFNNVSKLEAEAGRILAEVRRRNGNANQVENVVGAKGNTNVETVPVSKINVDAKRFQFKSNTNKSSGVDESNKLGGDWDARTAGNLYLWQDKNGKLYVVNGHHRLELAQRNGVENLNAIIDRESDGVTAEQARRNGVLINIRDGQGEVRDYASFVRSENMTEEEAKNQGVTARQKGRSGYLLGKSGNTLYEAYLNEVIPESKAVIIAEVAQGNEAIEYAGIKLATDRKLSGEVLRQTLKLAAQNATGKKSDTVQDSLFDMVDDSVLQEWEAIGKLAANHIKGIRTRIDAAKDAIKNPEAAKSLGVKTSKGAEQLLAKAQEELARWEHYYTDADLMAQLREEAGIKQGNVVEEAGKSDISDKSDLSDKSDKQKDTTGRFNPESETPLLSAEEDANDFQLVAESKEEAAKAEKEAQKDEVRKQEQAKEEAAKQSAELFADKVPMKKNPVAKSDVEKAIKMGGKRIEKILKSDLSYKEQIDKLDAIISKLPGTNFKDILVKIASDLRSHAYADRYEKVKRESRYRTVSVPHTYYKTLEEAERIKENAAKLGSNIEFEENPDFQGENEDVTPKPAKKSVWGDFKDRKEELGFSFDEFRKQYLPKMEAKVKSELKSYSKNYGNYNEDDWVTAANDALGKAYMNFDPNAGVKIETLANTYIKNAIDDVKRRMKRKKDATGGMLSIDQTNEDGESLANVIPDENASAVPKDESNAATKKYLELESQLSENDKKIFDLSNKGKSPTQIAHELGGKWTVQKVKDRLGKIRDAINKEMAKNFGFESKLSDDDKKMLDLNRKGYPGSKIAHDLGKGWNKEKVDARLKELKAVIADELGIEYRKKLHSQVNPVVVNGHVREEYADLLSKKEYTPTTLKELQDKAMDWIIKQGGIVQAADAIIHNKAPSNTAVAEIARRYILNSNVFANDVSYEDRVKLNKIEMNERSRAGLTLRSMRLDSLNLDDVASVQALLDKLHENMPSEEVRKLREEIKKKLDIDILKIDQKVVDDKTQLDALLRAELAHKASWGDKLYEYWINSILSGPTTHVANFAGNTANAVYELGIKRFTEALVNTVAGRKDGATFQEFKEMQKAFNWKNAKAAFLRSYDLEVLDPSGKFMENRNVAIGGKLGRAIRVPGRLLAAADAMAKAIIEPMETVAHACRMGVQQGYSGQELQKYIQAQLTDNKSVSYQWGKQRAKELAFQEEPGYFIDRLMALRETPGWIGTALRIMLPFIKTPTNIILQGTRKSVLGSVGLLFDTASRIKNKRGFDGSYVARVAEQIIAWGTVMAFISLDDDDELPLITGSSAPYGSAEYGFKANKIPPYSIRIGDKWFSYKRIEPMATGLALIADTLQAWKNAKNGKDGGAIIKDLFRGGGQIFLEKSFLDGLGEISKAWDDPDSFSRAIANPVKGLIPNLYTQMRQSFDENVQDTKSREKGVEWFKEQFFTVTNRAGITTALPKVDYFGRDVKKDDWGDESYTALWRILGVQRMDADSSVDKAERLILNYNQKNPDESWYPSIPQPTFKRDGQKYYFSGENYTNFAKDAGVLAHKQIKNAISAGRLNVNNPSKADIDLMKKVFTRARKETIDKHIKNAKKY